MFQRGAKRRMAKTKSEEYVAQLCSQSFLSLWSYPIPRGKNPGKKLCDNLVVCDPDIVIFSVKETGLTETGDQAADWERWRRKAIEDSAKQIYGAESYLVRSANVVTAEGEIALPLPEISRRRVHRVAVALGSQGKAPLFFGDDSVRGFLYFAPLADP